MSLHICKKIPQWTFTMCVKETTLFFCLKGYCVVLWVSTLPFYVRFAVKVYGNGQLSISMNILPHNRFSGIRTLDGAEYAGIPSMAGVRTRLVGNTPQEPFPAIIQQGRQSELILMSQRIMADTSNTDFVRITTHVPEQQVLTLLYIYIDESEDWVYIKGVSKTIQIKHMFKKHDEHTSCM